MIFRFLSLVLALLVSLAGLKAAELYPKIPPKVEFVVVIPSYNNENWCEKNLKSVLDQTYPYWSIYYINDCSLDKTGELVNGFVKKHNIKHKCTVVHNKERRNALANTFYAVHNIDPRKVVLILDGDDWFSHVRVLESIASKYADKNVWMTYGDYRQEPHRHGSICKPIPPQVAQKGSFRQERWIYGPIRTFYAKLFQLIKKEDLMWQGSFFKMTGDVAFMFPLLEMAAKGHIKYIPEVLYVYNVSNPINDYRLDADYQLYLEKKIRERPPYAALERLF